MKDEVEVAAILTKLATLAKLSISEAERPHLEKDLSKLISFIEQISQFNQIDFESDSSSKVAISGLRPDQFELPSDEKVTSGIDWMNVPKNFRVKRVVT